MSEKPKHTDACSVVSSVLEGRPEVSAAYVYGSAAVGRATPLSDVDVAVLLDPAVREEDRGALLRELTVALERANPGSRFDVRIFDELPVSIRGRVVSEGRRLLDSDPVRRVEAEVRARMEYHDFQIFERQGAREGLRGLRESLRNG